MRAIRWLIETDLWIPLAIVAISGVVIGGILYLSGAFALLGLGETDGGRAAAYEQAEQFLEALGDGRHEDAAGHVLLPGRSPGQREVARVLRSEAGLRGLTGGQLGHYRRRGETAVISGTLRVTDGQLACDVHLSRREGQWWISQLVLNGRPVFSSRGARGGTGARETARAARGIMGPWPTPSTTIPT